MNVTHLEVIFHNPSHLPTFPHPLIPHNSKDHSHQHGFRRQYRSHTSTWTLAAPQTEEAQSREWTIFCLLYLAVAQGQSNCAAGQHKPGQSLHKLQAAVYHPASPTKQGHAPLSRTAVPHTCGGCSDCVSCSVIFLISLSHIIHQNATVNCSVSQYIFFPKQIYMQILTAMSCWSGARFLVSEAP